MQAAAAIFHITEIKKAFEKEHLNTEAEALQMGIDALGHHEGETGEFVGIEYDGYADGNPVYYAWACSRCGIVFEEDQPHYNYCPNCGARMKCD